MIIVSEHRGGYGDSSAPFSQAWRPLAIHSNTLLVLRTRGHDSHLVHFRWGPLRAHDL